MKRSLEILCAQNWIQEVMAHQSIMEAADWWDGSTYVYACLQRRQLGGPLWERRYYDLSDIISMIK